MKEALITSKGTTTYVQHGRDREGKDEGRLIGTESKVL